MVESTQFKRLLEKAKYVGSDFKIPHRKKLEVRPIIFFLIFYFTNQTLGELLDINFKSVYNTNMAAIITKATLFGLVWLGDRATI